MVRFSSVFAGRRNLRTRGKLLTALEAQPEWGELENWLRQLNDPGWTTYLDDGDKKGG